MVKTIQCLVLASLEDETWSPREAIDLGDVDRLSESVNNMPNEIGGVANACEVTIGQRKILLHRTLLHRTGTPLRVT